MGAVVSLGQKGCISGIGNAFMIIYTNHADSALGSSLEVDDEGIVVVDMELEVASIVEGRMDEDMLVPSSDRYASFFGKLVQGITYRIDQFQILGPLVFLSECCNSLPEAL